MCARVTGSNNPAQIAAAAAAIRKGTNDNSAAVGKRVPVVVKH